MRRPNVNELVRIRFDLPERSLHRGDVGVVRSTWFSPRTAYEVEFDLPRVGGTTRVLLRADQVECDIQPDQSSDENDTNVGSPVG